MNFTDNSIFDIIHSLPVVTHSIAITTRTPTADYGQQSRFMPDYGGSLDIPTASIKHHGLGQGLPFSHRGPLISNINLNQNSKPSYCDSLIVIPVTSDPYSEYESLALQALKQNISVDLILQERVQDATQPLVNLSQLQFQHTILGLKYVAKPGLIAARFDKKVKIFRLKGLEDINHRSLEELSDLVSLESLASLSERGEFYIKDICSNIYNNNIQAIASDTFDQYQIKFFDLNSASKRPYQTIQWDSHESNVENTNHEPTEGLTLRKRTIRTYKQKTPALRGVQQLQNIPNHLVNCLVTTDHRIALVDPRQDHLGQVYVNKTDLLSIYPIEYLRRTEFSPSNDNQMYSLSNVHLRVFDVRYPGYPLNQVNHMLESDDYDILNMKTITHNLGLDTICISSSGRVCFITFEQNLAKPLVNPTSKHAPYHEEIISGDNRIHGLDAMVSNGSDSRLFSVLTLDSLANLQIRDYEFKDGDYPLMNRSSDQVDAIVSHVMNQDTSGDCVAATNSSRTGEPSPPSLESRIQDDEEKYIDVMEQQSDLEDKLSSRRAIERFQKMKEKLDKL